MLARLVFLCCCFVVDARAASVRVFVAPIAAGAGADRAEVALFDERVLAAARANRAFDVIGGRDVQTALDIEATRQAAGCSSDLSCAIEVAGALDAPQVVSGQLGRVGDTWVLALTRTERTTLTVLARVVRESHGDSPEGLLGAIDGAVLELFADGPGPSGWLLAGGLGIGVGVATLLVGTGAAVVSWSTFDSAQNALADPALSVEDKEQLRLQAQAEGAVTNNVAVACWVAGGVIAVVSVFVAVGLSAGGE